MSKEAAIKAIADVEIGTFDIGDQVIHLSIGHTGAAKIFAAISAAGLEIVKAHKWHLPEGIGFECCSDCGIVRRADDRHRPCLGPVRVGLRHLEPLKDEYTEGETPVTPKAQP